MMPVISRASKSAAESIDILPILQSYTIDFTAAFVFGLPRVTNFIMKKEARDEWLEAYIRSYPSDSMFWLQECPGLTKLIQKAGLADLVLPKGHEAARKWLDDWTLEKMRRAEDALYYNGYDEGKFTAGTFPILYGAVKSGLAKSCGQADNFTPDSKQELELASECFDHIREYRIS